MHALELPSGGVGYRRGLGLHSLAPLHLSLRLLGEGTASVGSGTDLVLVAGNAQVGGLDCECPGDVGRALAAWATLTKPMSGGSPAPWSVALSGPLSTVAFSPCPRSCLGRPFPLGPVPSTTLIMFNLQEQQLHANCHGLKRRLLGSL